MKSFEFEDVQTNTCVCGEMFNSSSASLTRKLAWGSVSFLGCAACGSWMQSPRLTCQSLAAWYNSEEYYAGKGQGGAYLNYRADEEHRRLEAKHRYQADLAALLPERGRVLEIGCATGSLVAELRSQGHDALGIDFSETFVRFARELNNLDIIQGDFLNLEIPGPLFDMIIMLGTVSNLQNLEQQLAKVARLLKPSGLFFFNMPAADSLTARLYGSQYWMFTASIMAFMTRQGAQHALERAGFTLRDWKHDRQQPSLGKLAGHAGLGFMFPTLRRLKLESTALPFAIPVPGVYCAVAENRPV